MLFQMTKEEEDEYREQYKALKSEAHSSGQQN
jgi:hypothetical protein